MLSLSCILKNYIMVLRLENDFGTLQCSFNGISVWFCDDASNRLFEDLQKRFKSLYGDSFELDYLLLDLDKLDVKVFRLFQDDILPFQTVSFAYFYRRVQDCDLLRFANIFSRRKFHFVNGRASWLPNRNYLRLTS